MIFSIQIQLRKIFRLFLDVLLSNDFNKRADMISIPILVVIKRTKDTKKVTANEDKC